MTMQLNGITIDDSFAEAFPMKATRLIVTAHNLTWARHAAVATTGFATSVIACGCDVGTFACGIIVACMPPTSFNVL